MLDFIKLLTYSNQYATFLKNHPLLDWSKHSIDYRTETTNSQCSYRSMSFEIINNPKYQDPLIIISGSLHKYKNSGMHNYDDFTVPELIKTVYSFCKEFQIDCHKMIVQSPEIGVNILPPYIPNADLFNRFIVINTDGGTKPPAPIAHRDSSGYNLGIRFQCSCQYSLKCYAKENKALRIEIQIDKMQKLQNNKILSKINFSSLYNFCLPENQEQLFNVLVIDTFRKVLINEYVEPSHKLSDQDFNIYQKAMRPDTWLEIKDKNAKRSLKFKVGKIQNEHGNYSTKEEIVNLLIEKKDHCLTMSKEAYLTLEKLNSLEYLKYSF